MAISQRASALILACIAGVMDAVQAERNAPSFKETLELTYQDRTALEHCVKKYLEAKDDKKKFSDIAVLLMESGAKITVYLESLAADIDLDKSTIGKDPLLCFIKQKLYEQTGKNELGTAYYNYAIYCSGMFQRDKFFSYMQQSALHADGDGMFEYAYTDMQNVSSLWSQKALFLAIAWLEKSCYHKRTVEGHRLAAVIDILIQKFTSANQSPAVVFAAQMSICRIWVHFNGYHSAVEMFNRAKKLYLTDKNKDTIKNLSFIEIFKTHARVLVADKQEAKAVDYQLGAAALGDIDSALAVADWVRTHPVEDQKKIKEYCTYAMKNALAAGGKHEITETRMRIRILSSRCTDKETAAYLTQGIFVESKEVEAKASSSVPFPEFDHTKVEQEFARLEKTLNQKRIAIEEKFAAELKEITSIADKHKVIATLVEKIKDAIKYGRSWEKALIKESLLTYLKNLVTREDITQYLPIEHALFATDTPEMREVQSYILRNLLNYLSDVQSLSFQESLNAFKLHDLAAILKIKGASIEDLVNDAWLCVNACIHIHFNEEPKFADDVRIRSVAKKYLMTQQKEIPKWRGYLKYENTLSLQNKIRKYLDCELMQPDKLLLEMKSNYMPAFYFYALHLEKSKLKNESYFLLLTKLLCMTHQTKKVAEEYGLPESQILKMRKYADANMQQCLHESKDQTTRQFFNWCYEFQRNHAGVDFDKPLLQAPMTPSVAVALRKSYHDLGAVDVVKQMPKKMENYAAYAVAAANPKESKELTVAMQCNDILGLYFYDQQKSITKTRGFNPRPHVVSRLLLCVKFLCLTHAVESVAKECGVLVSELNEMRKSADAFLKKCQNPDDEIYAKRKKEPKTRACVEFANWCYKFQEAAEKNVITNKDNFTAENIDQRLLNAVIQTSEKRNILFERLKKAYSNLDRKDMVNALDRKMNDTLRDEKLAMQMQQQEQKRGESKRDVKSTRLPAIAPTSQRVTASEEEDLNYALALSASQAQTISTFAPSAPSLEPVEEEQDKLYKYSYAMIIDSMDFLPNVSSADKFQDIGELKEFFDGQPKKPVFVQAERGKTEEREVKEVKKEKAEEKLKTPFRSAFAVVNSA